MKKFNYKSRKGFTLIELLVVIGILAVLAAIAIPSVAGLIDRANVSSDDTNANEMTNAIERFTSEYELFCQDIASGKFNPNDLDSAQSRVYNVTGADSREDITQLENSGLDNKKINRDTKYPENLDTTKAIVENYTKTSSATYEPKQSDMNFYYSPDCGLIVVSETTDNPNPAVLNKLVIFGKDAKGRTLDSSTRWINLTTGTDTADLMYIHKEKIPTGAEYITSTGDVLTAGEPFPDTTVTGDTYIYGEYTYKFNQERNNLGWSSISSVAIDGWSVSVSSPVDGIKVAGTNEDRDFTQQENYGPVLASINNKYVTSYMRLFSECSQIKTLSSDFKIHDTVKSINRMFAYSGIVNAPNHLVIPEGVKDITFLFLNCYYLETLPANFKIPHSVTSAQRLFSSCRSLKTIPDTFVLHEGIEDVKYLFHNCHKLEKLPNNFAFPSTAKDFSSTFANCHSLVFDKPLILPESAERISLMFYEAKVKNLHLIINGNPTVINSVFTYNEHPIVISGTSTRLQDIINASNYCNVSIVQ